MLRKLVRIIFTLAGAIFGYGIFLLAKYLIGFFGNGEWVDFSKTQEFYLAALCAIIFGLLFFRLTPTIKKQGNKNIP